MLKSASKKGPLILYEQAGCLHRVPRENLFSSACELPNNVQGATSGSILKVLGSAPGNSPRNDMSCGQGPLNNDTPGQRVGAGIAGRRLGCCSGS